MLLVAAALVVALSLSGAYAIRSRERLLESEVKARGRAVLAGVSALAREALVTERYEALAQALARLQRDDPEVIRVVVTDAHGVEVGRSPFPPTREARPLEFTETLSTQGFTLGQVEVVLATGALGERIDETTRLLVLTLVDTMLLVGFVVHLALKRYVTLPLATLVDAADRVAAGDFAARTGIRTDDEVGQLSSAFDAMGEDLMEYRDEVQENRRMLEARIEARTREVRERDARLRRQDRLSSLGTLAAGLAHELNNPLGNLSTYAQLLEEGIEDPARRAKALKVIQAEAARAAGIVGRLLGFARPSAPTREAAAPEALARRAAELLEPVLAQKGVRLEVRPGPPDTPAVLCDKEQLHQVLVNLVMNAAQAMDGGGLVTLEVLPGGDGRDPGLAVHDQGPGIPEGLRERLFDPFFTTKAPGQGTGLGLAVCYGIVEEHGGTISLENRPGGGATATVRLPPATRDGPTTPKGPDPA